MILRGKFLFGIRVMVLLPSLIFLAAVVGVSPAWAQNETTVGSLMVSVTFDTIWVKATYTGDPNANNSMALQYKLVSSPTWLDAYSPAPDRRSTVSGGNSNAANQKQFRSGVFGLTAGSAYNVRVTYSDPDGVTGGPTLSNSATLLSSATVVRSGGTFYLDNVGSNGNGSSGSPFNTFANAFAGTACGDKLIVKPGSYANFTFSKSCSASTWYVIEGEDRDTVLINNASPQQILVSGDFVQIKNLRSLASSCRFIDVTANRHDVWIENVRADDINTSVTSSGHAATYDCDGIRFNGGTYHGYVLNSQLYAPTLSAFGSATPRWDSASNGIMNHGSYNPIGGFVYKGNTIGTSTANGAFRDCIGNDQPEGPTGAISYSDILNNKITGCRDDGIQMEGDNINLLMAGNIINANNGYSCFASQAGFYGPIFWLRNTCRISWTGDTGYAWKAGGLQFAFLFHNSIETINANHDIIADALGSTTTMHITARNNIFKALGNSLHRVFATGTTFNYNDYYRANSSNIVSSWNGTANYTFAQFQSSAGQETNGRNADPLFSDMALHLQAGSPVIDKGIVLSNINSLDSAWPYRGSAPDIGAYELNSGSGSDTTSPTAPTNVQAQ